MKTLQFSEDLVKPQLVKETVGRGLGLTVFFMAFPGICFLILVSLAGCSNTDQEIKELEEYSGPLQLSQNIEIIHSDSARIALRLRAPVQIVYQSLDQEYPEGVDIIIYNRAGDQTTIKANHGYYEKEGNLYRIEGNVRLENTVRKQKMNTEELIWTPNDEKVKTDRFVTSIS